MTKRQWQPGDIYRDRETCKRCHEDTVHVYEMRSAEVMHLLGPERRPWNVSTWVYRCTKCQPEGT